MRNFWTYGCSHTAGFEEHGGVPHNGNYKDYYVWRGGNFPKTYTELLAEEFNLTLRNHAQGGTSVTMALYIMTETFQAWQPDDVVLFQTTYQERYQYLSVWDGAFQPFDWGQDPNSDYVPDISYKAQAEFLANRTDNKAWQRETMACIRSAKALADSKGCHFLVAPYDQYTIEVLFERPEEYKDIHEYLIYQTPDTFPDLEWTFPTPYWTFGDFEETCPARINQETNYEIDDNHMGELGNKLLAKIISPYLRKFL